MSFNSNSRLATNSNNNTVKAPESKNDTIQTVPEKDIALSISMNKINSFTTPANNTATSANTSNRSLSDIDPSIKENINIQNVYSSKNLINQKSNPTLAKQLSNSQIHSGLNYSTPLSTTTHLLNPYRINQPLNEVYYSNVNYHAEVIPNYQSNAYQNQRMMQNLQTQHMRNSFQPDLSYRTCNYLPGINIENTNDSLSSGDTSIDRMRMKQMLLEQQVNNSSNQQPINGLNNTSYYHMKLKEMETLSGEIIAELNRNILKDSQITSLEKLLKEKDYEIQQFELKSNNEKENFEQEVNKIKMNLESKESELLEVETKVTGLQKENDTLKLKNKELESYLTSLPTSEEINEKLTEMNNANEKLKNQIQDYEKKYTRAKQIIKGKQNEVKDLEEKFQKVFVEKQNLQNEFDSIKDMTVSADEVNDLREERMRDKAELKCAQVLLNSHKKQLNDLQAKHQHEIIKLKENTKLELEDAMKLTEQIDDRENVINSLKVEVKELKNYNQLILNDNSDLKSKITAFEKLVNIDYQKLVKNVFKEVECCTKKLNLLVNNCIDIYDGKEINVSSLITNANLQYNDIDISAHIVNGIICSEYLQSKFNELKQLKNKIDDLRRSVSLKYAENVGKEISSSNSCSVQ